MPNLTRPGRRPSTTPTVAELVDWRADERVRRLDDREADLARQAEQAAAALEAATADRPAAQAAHAAGLAAYLRGDADERPADPADGVPEAQRRVDDVARERAELASLRPAVEAEARAAATAAVLGVYRPTVARLATALEAARAANAAVVALWAAAYAAGLDVPSFAWRPLANPDDLLLAVHPADRDHAAWQLAATALVAGGTGKAPRR